MQRSSQPTQLKSKFKALTALNCPGALLAPQESQQLLPRCVAQAGQVERAMTEEVGRPPKKDAPPPTKVQAQLQALFPKAPKQRHVTVPGAQTHVQGFYKCSRRAD